MDVPRARTAVLFVALATCIVATRSALSNRRRGPALGSESIFLPPAATRALALSFRSVIADLFWIHYLQAVPLSPADAVTGRALATELQTVITLDPTFRAPYVQGTVLLSVLGNQPCASLSILRSGEQRMPSEWRLAFQAGYECLSELGDSACAERQFRRAAALPGSPVWLPGLVARLLAQSEQASAAVDYLRAQLAATKDARLRAQFAERLRQAELTVEIDRTDAAVRRWRAGHGGVFPESVAALVSAGLLSPPPRDPMGGQIELGADGRARSTTGAGRLRTFAVDLVPATLEERLLPERNTARVEPIVGHPAYLHPESDRARVDADITVAAAGLWRSRDWVDPYDLGAQSTLETRLGRVIVADEVRHLRDAQLALLREHPDRSPTMPEIVERADVPPDDPWGTRWRFDSTGQPAPVKAHYAAVLGAGASACAAE